MTNLENSAPAANEKHPAGLYLLFASEMWERFSYYGMRAVLALYLTKALLYDKALASNLYGGYVGLVYLTPLIGGFVADRYWGNRRSIIVGGISMSLGQFTLFASALLRGSELGTFFLFLGLGLMIVGNGFFKPNISSMVGSLYGPTDRRRDSAYTIF
ncbi:MAG: oligopeptide:H+ symporter, partial [Bernardetiaceae bacterium]|nr:oligopeptide:H+ symporter [Bernardetiaceae bacterium]